MTGTDTRHAADHQRINTGLLSHLERRTLLWIAPRLPGGVSSDHLTLLALVAMAGAGVSFALIPATPWAALGVVASLAVNWFGDSLDGTLARVRSQQRPRYGYYVDHAIDLAGTTLLLIGAGASGLISPLAACALLGGYLLVSAETYLATHATGVFRMSFMGCGPTELRILLALATMKASAAPWATVPGVGQFLWFDLAAAAGTVGLAVTFATAVVRNGRTLYIEEPLPRRAPAVTAS
ncbi:MAG: CDP-alcohol phosphatidyltransferase family protein [Vicinamibacterales bacterium]